jgi:RimJ/RimL family protein N-acetyltransferase
MRRDLPLPEDLPERLSLGDLCLRRASPGDGAALCAAVTASLPDLRPWMPWAQSETDVEQSELVVRRMHDDFGSRIDLPMLVFETDAGGAEGRLVGGTGLHRIDWALRRFEIGYWRRRGCDGRGIATRCAQAMSRLAFDHLAARRVEIRLDSRNWRSARVAEQAGFSLEGILRQDSLSPDGRWRDTRVYARVRGVEEA